MKEVKEKATRAVKNAKRRPKKLRDKVL